MRLSRTLRSGALATLALAVSAAALPVLADQVVYFVNGKAMTVTKIEKGDRLTILEIEGGGRIGVPTIQIDRIENLQPASPPVSTVAVPAPPAPLPAAAAPAAAEPAVAPPAPETAAAPVPKNVTPGPAIGGNPLAANAGLSAARPLSIGADDADAPRPGGLSRPYAGAMQTGLGQQGGLPGTLGGPGMAARRFGARGAGAFGRGRPPLDNYKQRPGNGGPPPAPTSQQPARPAGAPGASPPAAPPAAQQQPAAPPQPPPAAEPPPPNPEPPPDAGGDPAATDDGSQDPGSGDDGSGGN